MSSKTTVPDRYYTPQLPKKPVVDHSEAYQPTPKPDTVYIDENLRVSNNDFCCFSCRKFYLSFKPTEKGIITKDMVTKTIEVIKSAGSHIFKDYNDQTREVFSDRKSPGNRRSDFDEYLSTVLPFSLYCRRNNVAHFF
ncbi:hypothetical protein EDC94DRAFT_582044 [Helicostylum pulchrum]|nr:hypothetical protein EDC94DRAFT_582044 [Helicostylum pulchrum]